ncbi:MAG: GerMN domain-containing protein [Ruminococcus sp.]|nr:GerMN domain-containing protein [Ruminococcus sp.]
MKRLLLIFSCFLLLLIGCSGGESESTYKLYEVNYVKKTIEYQPYYPEVEETEAMLAEMVEKLSMHDESGGAFLPENVEILKYELYGDVLNVDLSSAYRKLNKNNEILCRAALVKNFVQVPDVRYVQFSIEGEAFLDSHGNAIGIMNADSFLENSGKDITAYQYQSIQLYFANEAGNKLVQETRNVYYTGNSTIEKVIVEQLIRGPKETGHYATMPTSVQIYGVSVADGIAYVNLGQKFIDEALSIQQEIPIYSIANSLIDAGNVTKVQISVNGETKLTFRESMRLDQLFEKNMELVEGSADTN